ncbi:hypothetical protein [Adlercreutzia sp. ZJ141]|uniref:hypothetical protein n=1 Tax=Adlercreutzia sp. ZJ141 TaxID=2709406 RepID=UPI0013EDFE0A|nr:hypothetical protein [Adlercreutzia sp. ZJ141]
MSAADLDEYARGIGIETGHAKGIDAKMKLIESRRSRVATIRALGIDFEVPVKRAHDKRVSDLLSGQLRDEDAEQALLLLLGADQMAELTAACTDEDGTVDVGAIGVAFTKILTSPELKNF